MVIIQLPKLANGNQYVVAFVDFLTKWPEVVFTTPDQSAETIVQFLVERVICCHGVPSEAGEQPSCPD